MKIAFRIVVSLVILSLLAAGGYMAYQAGIAQGVSQAPAVATAIEKAVENGQPPMVYGHPGYGYGYGYPRHFGFNPFGGLCFSVFFLFLAFGFMKMLFFRHAWHGGHHRHGPWGRHWEDSVPSMFNEWHKKAHGEGEKEGEDRKQ